MLFNFILCTYIIIKIKYYIIILGTYYRFQHLDGDIKIIYNL